MDDIVNEITFIAATLGGGQAASAVEFSIEHLAGIQHAVRIGHSAAAADRPFFEFADIAAAIVEEVHSLAVFTVTLQTSGLDLHRHHERQDNQTYPQYMFHKSVNLRLFVLNIVTGFFRRRPF